ncbi:exodeoxyribonuclease VII large subunit [Thermodesulfovibrio hydrogeniphilus]
MFNVEVAYQTLSNYLIELKELIQEVSDYQWIVAEIAKIGADKNGHYWLELVEKKDDEIIAQCKAVIWRSQTETIRNFQLKTGMSLQSGLKILFLGRATFHEKHGFSIYINQIDPSFTIGEMALKKKEIIDRLTREGLIDRNKLIEVPIVIQRIAIVSSATAAGYEDFLNILHHNEYHFKFYTYLFDSFVQGEGAAISMIESLKQCASLFKNFDAVVIIRGGGSVVDLHSFNDYELAKTIALMPLPVFTGIGHTRDETVADYVASKSFKTPSELAKFIISRAFDYYARIEDLRKRILNRVQSLLKIESGRIDSIKDRFISSTRNSIIRANNELNIKINSFHADILKRMNIHRESIHSLKHELHRKATMRLRQEEILLNKVKHEIKLKTSHFSSKIRFDFKSSISSLLTKTNNLIRIENLQIDRLKEKLNLLSPENVLKRGYSITYLNGKLLKSAEDVKLGQQLHIKLYKGKITGKVTGKEEENGELKLF